jgi:hypothetical protein
MEALTSPGAIYDTVFLLDLHLGRICTTQQLTTGTMQLAEEITKLFYELYAKVVALRVRMPR